LISKINFLRLRVILGLRLYKIGNLGEENSIRLLLVLERNFRDRNRVFFKNFFNKISSEDFLCKRYIN